MSKTNKTKTKQISPPPQKKTKTKTKTKETKKKKKTKQKGKHKTNKQKSLNTHFLLTVYILYKRTKFPSNIVFTSQSRICLWCREHLCNWPKKSIICTMIEWQICGGIMFLPYAVEDNIERKKNWVKCCLKWKFK